MKLWHIRGRWLITNTDLRPKHSGISEQLRCQILGDYPTREKALAGAQIIIKRRKDINDHYEQPNRRNHHDPDQEVVDHDDQQP